MQVTGMCVQLEHLWFATCSMKLGCHTVCSLCLRPIQKDEVFCWFEPYFWLIADSSNWRFFICKATRIACWVLTRRCTIRQSPDWKTRSLGLTTPMLLSRNTKVSLVRYTLYHTSLVVDDSLMLRPQIHPLIAFEGPECMQNSECDTSICNAGSSTNRTTVRPQHQSAILGVVKHPRSSTDKHHQSLQQMYTRDVIVPERVDMPWFLSCTSDQVCIKREDFDCWCRITVWHNCKWDQKQGFYMHWPGALCLTSFGWARMICMHEWFATAGLQLKLRERVRGQEYRIYNFSEAHKSLVDFQNLLPSSTTALPRDQVLPKSVPFL